MVPQFTPSIRVLYKAARSLERGSWCSKIDTQAGRLRLVPAETHDVEGGPSRTLTIDYVPAASVLHFRYAADAATPWRGNGPVEVAALAGRLSAETVRALAEESSGPVGRFLGIPVDGADATVEGLKADIKNAAGRCLTCGEPFTPKRRDAKYCQPYHRLIAFRKRDELIVAKADRELRNTLGGVEVGRLTGAQASVIGHVSIDP